MPERSVLSTNMNYDITRMRHLPVDAEHLGVRIIVPVVSIAALVGVLVGGPALLEALGGGGLSLLTLPLAIAAAVGAAYASDRLLKRYWPSGRELLLGDRHLVLRERSGSERVIDLEARLNLLAWRFTVPRRGRVPKGYLCLSVQLLQDERQITAYTFYDPAKTAVIQDFFLFTPLASRRMSQDERLSLRAAGEQRRLLQAEDERWRDGAELFTDDFLTLWAALAPHRSADQMVSGS